MSADICAVRAYLDQFTHDVTDGLQKYPSCMCLLKRCLLEEVSSWDETIKSAAWHTLHGIPVLCVDIC